MQHLGIDKYNFKLTLIKSVLYKTNLERYLLEVYLINFS